MKVIATLILTVIAMILLAIKKEYRSIILGSYVVIMVLFGVFYNYKTINNIVSFHRPTEQTFYQKEYMENGDYPDAILPIILNGKTVYTKNDHYTIDKAEEEGKNWMYSPYHKYNAINFMEFCGAEVNFDRAYNKTMISDADIENDFENLGRTNDMFRYSFMHAKGDEFLWNYFNFYWYYYEYLGDAYVYIETTQDELGDTVYTADELMVLWDSPKDHEEENLYIMTKTYYDSNAIKEEQ